MDPIITPEPLTQTIALRPTLSSSVVAIKVRNDEGARPQNDIQATLTRGVAVVDQVTNTITISLPGAAMAHTKAATLKAPAMNDDKPVPGTETLQHTIATAFTGDSSTSTSALEPVGAPNAHTKAAALEVPALNAEIRASAIKISKPTTASAIPAVTSKTVPHHLIRSIDTSSRLWLLNTDAQIQLCDRSWNSDPHTWRSSNSQRTNAEFGNWWCDFGGGGWRQYKYKRAGWDH